MATRCNPTTLDAEAVAGDSGVVGQERAREAVAFAVATARNGHHLFVMGPPGSGERTLVRRAIEAHVGGDGRERSDWTYVNNFAEPHQPRALCLPRGRAVALREHMKDLADDLRTKIPATFESEEYATAAERMHAEFKERAEQAVLAVGAEAERNGLVMVRTPVGLSFAPRKRRDDSQDSAKEEDAVLAPQEFEALPEATRQQLQQAMANAQEQLVRTLRGTVRLRNEHADRVRALNRSMTLVAVEHAVDEAKAHYADLPDVLAYLDAVRADVSDKADHFHSAQSEETAEGVAVAEIDLSAYEVNVLVDAAGSDGAPIVAVDHPTCQQLIGRVDHIAHMGTLHTDYRLIKPGALHRANGGYVLIDAVKLLTQPFAWEALKRALLRGEVRIESLAEMISLVSTVQLEPAPIPLQVKVVLFGDREVGALLQALDDDFPRLFRVIADFSDELPRAAETQRALARSLRTQAQRHALLAPSTGALARLIDHGAREAGDATRISASVQRLLDVLMEADHNARSAQRTQIDVADIDAAIAARRRRASRIDERLRDEVARGMLMIATSGERVGQINGLMGLRVRRRDLR